MYWEHYTTLVFLLQSASYIKISRKTFERLFLLVFQRVVVCDLAAHNSQELLRWHYFTVTIGSSTEVVAVAASKI